MTPALPSPRAGARVHLVAHRVNGTIAAYQRAGDGWRLFVTLDDGATVVTGAHEARYVGADGRQGELVMPTPVPTPSPIGTADARPYRAAVALAEQILADRPTHGSVTAETKTLAAATVDLWHLARGLSLGDPAAIAHATALFTTPVAPALKPQGVTHG